MKNLTNILKQIWKDESGQGATEYILMLVVVVGIAIAFKEPIKNIISEKTIELGSEVSSFTSQ